MDVRTRWKGVSGVGKRELPKHKPGRRRETACWRCGSSWIGQTPCVPKHQAHCVCPLVDLASGSLSVWVARHEKESSTTRAQLNSKFLSGNYLLASRNILWKGQALAGQNKNIKSSIRIFVDKVKPLLGNWQKSLHLWNNQHCPASHCSCQWQTGTPDNFSSLSWPMQWWHSCFLTTKRQLFLSATPAYSKRSNDISDWTARCHVKKHKRNSPGEALRLLCISSTSQHLNPSVVLTRF